MNNASSSSVSDTLSLIQNQEPFHVVILHEKLAKRKVDRYVLNLALALDRIGFKVTLMTSHYDRKECPEDLNFQDKIKVKYSAWWIPNSIFGFFKRKMSALKAAWMAYRLTFFPPEPKPFMVILDINMWSLYMLKIFTTYRLIYLENFLSLNISEACYEHSQLNPTLLESRWIKIADEILVQSEGYEEMFRKSYPNCQKSPICLYPSIDIGLWNEKAIKIERIVPDLLDNTVLFLTVGKYRRSSNFRLALEAFEILLELIDDKTISKRFQLVFAGNCKSIEEKMFYNDLTEDTKGRLCASQVTFLKQLPVIHEKTLIMESAIMVHPARNDVFSDFVLRAMSLGKPIVATNRGIASKLLVHRLSGVIIEPEARLFAVAMKKLMMSPHLQIFLGDMAKDSFQKNYSFDSMCDKLGHVMVKYVPAGRARFKIRE